MAIRFITGMTTTSNDEIRVVIIHDPLEGYILSHDGQVITEEMSLREFMERLLHNIVDKSNGELHRREEEIISAIRTSNHTRINHMVDILNRRYATLIKNKKLVLAEHHHTYSYSESISNNERTITQSGMTKPEKDSLNYGTKGDGRTPLWDQEKFRQEMEHQGFKMSDGSSLRIADSDKAGNDEIYYLLTTPS